MLVIIVFYAAIVCNTQKSGETPMATLYGRHINEPCLICSMPIREILNPVGYIRLKNRSIHRGVVLEKMNIP